MDEQITVTLDDEAAAIMANKLDDGSYSSADDVMREALRALAERDEERKATLEAIKERVAAALADPRPSVPLHEAFRRINDRLQAVHGAKS